MHHPIQMKPADTENRNGKTRIVLKQSKFKIISLQIISIKII